MYGSPVEDKISEWTASFERSTRRFENLVAGLTREQAGWRPEPGRWSVAECIEHLNVTATTYFVRLHPALRSARERGPHGATIGGRGTLLGRYILGALDPARAAKLTAPRIFRPRPQELDFARVCDDFRAVQGRFGELLELAGGLDLGRVKLSTPVSRFVRVTAAEAFGIHALHEARHLGQAERVVGAPGFPRAGI